MNSVVAERLRLGRPSVGGGAQSTRTRQLCLRSERNWRPWPSATEKEGEMLAFARRPAKARGSWRPALEAVERFGGVVGTELRRLPRVPAGGGGPPPIDTG